MAKLALSDIMDLRQYEMERDSYRSEVIALKEPRRIALGKFMTLVFENRETIRFQIQEMARAEKMVRDEQIQTEIDIYNSLIPESGELKATLFLELVSKEELMEWLPALVGIEEALYLELGDGDKTLRHYSRSENAHKSQLSRSDTTASVHYVEWVLDELAQSLFRSSDVYLGVDHLRYQARVKLSDATHQSLLADW